MPLLPVSRSLWVEVLSVSGNIEIDRFALPSPTPTPQAGITLSATLTAAGFTEERDGIKVFGVRGEVCMVNDGQLPTVGLAILDIIQYTNGSDPFQDYISEQVDVTAQAST